METGACFGGTIIPNGDKYTLFCGPEGPQRFSLP
jgi:hypothetical protein